MIMQNEYDDKTGLPIDESYLEVELPEYLKKSLDTMKQCSEIMDSGGYDYFWDCKWCELNADINSAEVDELISHRQATYLRKKYLRMDL